MTGKSILIIAFYYPPYPKVGSRRWVKFAKYLNRHKINLHVLAAQMDVDKISPWDDDAKEIEHLTTRIHFKYKIPYYKRISPNSFVSKIKWHASKWISRLNGLKKSQGNPDDDSEKYASDFLNNARKIIKEKNIETVIYTASPNHLAYHISNLKKEFNHVKFIFDLRDYWSDWMQHLSKEQYNYELNLEQKTITNSDIILSPAEKIIETLQARYKNKASTMKVCSHAFDNDDFKNINCINLLNEHKKNITLVYGGSMYDNMEKNMEVLSSLLLTNKNIKILFYTFTDGYNYFFKDIEIKDRVIYLKPIDIKDFFLKVKNEADGLLYMRSTLNNDNNFLSSKFFDFLPLRKPIIYLGNEGDALDFIINNKIGFHLNKKTVPKFELLLNEVKKTIHKFDINPFSFETITKQLENEL